ncbi:hypothetical protein KR018_003170, partial [Drosophila ironensis]
NRVMGAIFADPGSPLTPLAPMHSGQAFSFDDDVTPTGPGGGRNHTTSRAPPFRGLKSSRLQVPGRRTAGSAAEPTRFSQAFMRTRSVFSPSGQSATGTSAHPQAPACSTSLGDPEARAKRASKIKEDILRSRQRATVKHDLSWVKREPGERRREESSGNLTRSLSSHFQRGSPVPPPGLSPRVKSLLDRTGNEHLTELFTRQEIDIEVLIQMTLEDLVALGVRGAREVKIVMQIIQLAKQFF